MTFTSSSTVRHLVDALGGVAALEGVTLASIGPVTSRTMRSLGLEPDVEVSASPYTTERLVDTLTAHFAPA